MKESQNKLYHTKSLAEHIDCPIDTGHFLKLVKYWGTDLVGIGNVSEGLAKEFRHLPVAVSLAIAHPPLREGVLRRDSVVAYSNQFPLVDERLENIQKRIALFLRSLGRKAFIIPPDTAKQDSSFAAKLFPLFPHKTAATCAGLGWVGKNGLLITREYGARLSWGTVLTDAPLRVSADPYLIGQCNGCSRCVEACPAGAIMGKEWSRENSGEVLVDVEKCAGHLSYHRQVIGKPVCAHCILACPVGKQKKVYRSK